MQETTTTLGTLLAAYWLDSENQIVSPVHTFENLGRFSKLRGLAAPDQILEEAAKHLNGRFSKGDVDQWITFICFFGHPHALWNFLLDAVEVAENDDHMEKIAACLVKHILAHYGSMMPYFEARARDDYRFKRMLTGVWRHRMSDQVWIRLRTIQAEVADPLPNMIPLEYGADYKSDTMKWEDRKTDDKGRYVCGSDGEWILRPRNEE